MSPVGEVSNPRERRHKSADEDVSGMLTVVKYLIKQRKRTVTFLLSVFYQKRTIKEEKSRT